MKHLIKTDNIASLDGVDYGRVVFDDGSKATYLQFADPDYVDLGLPSGTLWRNRNIGAETPEDPGLFFAWGETVGYAPENVGNVDGQKKFSWDDYKYGSAYNKLTKYINNASYCADGVTPDNKLVLDPEDDAATVNLGGGAFMPTHEHCQELFQNTDKVLVLTDGSEIEYKGSEADYFNWPSNNYNGNDVKLKGVKFVNRTDPSKFIFVPAAGGAYDGGVSVVGVGGVFWSSSLYGDYADSVWFCYFSDGVALVGYDDRCYGYSVRAVR